MGLFFKGGRIRMFQGRYRYALVCAVMLMMTLAACGGEAPAAPTPVAQPTAAPTSAPAEPAAPPTNTVPAETATPAGPSVMTPQQIAATLRPATVLVKSTFGETAITPEGL